MITLANERENEEFMKNLNKPKVLGPSIKAFHVVPDRNLKKKRESIRSLVNQLKNLNSKIRAHSASEPNLEGERRFTQVNHLKEILKCGAPT